jgi:hypothetical protein
MSEPKKSKPKPLEWILFWGVLLIGYVLLDAYEWYAEVRGIKWPAFGVLAVFVVAIRLMAQAWK